MLLIFLALADEWMLTQLLLGTQEGSRLGGSQGRAEVVSLVLTEMNLLCLWEILGSWGVDLDENSGRALASDCNLTAMRLGGLESRGVGRGDQGCTYRKSGFSKEEPARPPMGSERAGYSSIRCILSL